MRVGIVTVYDSGNYGSFLQAFAMKKYLEDRGHQVFFIKHRSFLKIVIKEILIGMKQGIKHGPGIFIHRVKKCLYQYRDLKNFNVLSNNKRKTRELDLLLLGSDEIWNIRKPYFKNLIFFGKYKENIKTIAFAVSCGMAEEEDYPEEIVNQLKKISRIYVRDEFSKQIVKNICDRDVDIVMDPTLLQVPFWKNMNKPRKIKEEYLLVYGYKFSEKQFHNIKRYAKENGLKTVAVCLYQTWCDKNLNISALDFKSQIIPHRSY